MSHSKRQVEEAMHMYISEGKPIPQIAAIMKIPEGTVYRWRREGKWDNFIRSSGKLGLALQMRKEFVEEIYKAIESKTLTDPGVADKLSKLSKVIENIMPSAMTLSNIFTLLECQAEYVNSFTSGEFNKLFQRYLPEMSDYLRKKFTTG